MYRIIYLLTFAVTISNSLGAIYVEIIAPDYKNQNIIWKKKTDYISNKYVTIDTKIIDSTGKVRLYGQFNEIELTEISIGQSVGFIYVDTATKNYKILFPKDTISELTSLKKSQVQLIFLDLAKKDINQLILRFNLYYDFFLYGDTNKLIRMAKHDNVFQDSLNSFKIFVSEKFGLNKIKYLHNYIRYEIGLLEQMAHKSKGSVYSNYLFNTYLKRHSIEYNNDAYMQFFNLFYLEAFRVAGNELYEKVLFTVNKLKNYQQLDSLLTKNIFFSPPRLRELAVIKGLYDGYSSNELDHETAIAFLSDIAKFSKWPKHKEIAKKCVEQLLKFKIGGNCPDFNLVNNRNEYVNIESCKNKYTYINFFANWNYKSLQEIQIIQSMAEKYNFINFISIDMNTEKSNYEDYSLKNKIPNWQICKPINNEEIIELFNLHNLPAHMLIDPQGKISQYPAYPPTPLYNNQSIDITFFNIQKNYSKKNHFKIGGKN